MQWEGTGVAPEDQSQYEREIHELAAEIAAEVRYRIRPDDDPERVRKLVNSAIKRNNAAKSSPWAGVWGYIGDLKDRVHSLIPRRR